MPLTLPHIDDEDDESYEDNADIDNDENDDDDIYIMVKFLYACNILSSLFLFHFGYLSVCFLGCVLKKKSKYEEIKKHFKKSSHAPSYARRLQLKL